MADKTKIEWTEATWNPITGCSVHSAGCTNCYAMKLAGTRLQHLPSRAGLTVPTKAGPVWTGEVRFNEDWLTQPLTWKRPRMIFVCAHADLFHESVPDEWIDRIFAVMAQSPQHIFQVLTKRSARMRAYLGQHRWHKWAALARELRDQFPKLRTPDIRGGDCCPVPNVWLGVSVENQAAADERIPDLLATPAALRWLSCEPLLGPVDLRWIAQPDDEADGVIDSLLGCNWIDGMGRGVAFHPVRPGHQGREMTRWVCSSVSDILANPKIDWVVAGGESGRSARPMHPDWARSLRDQCAAADVPFFFKQWGAWGPSGCVENEGIEDINRGFTKWEYGHFNYHDDFQIDALARSSRGHVDDAYGLKISGEHVVAMWRVGKKAAGRLLDDVLHDGMPS